MLNLRDIPPDTLLGTMVHKHLDELTEIVRTHFREDPAAGLKMVGEELFTEIMKEE